MRIVRSITILLTALALAACSSSSSEPEQVIVTAVDYGFGGVPAAVGPGTVLVLSNESSVEVHELVAIRLPDEEPRSVAELVALPPAELAEFFPLVETVLVAPPGESSSPVEGNGALREPGRYALICVIPTGADPDEYLAAAAEAEGGPPQVAGGPPHIAHGMYAEIVVEG